VIAAGAFAIGEMLTTSFFLAPFALGAAFAASVDATVAGTLPSWIAFVVVSLLTLLTLRPIAVRHMHSAPQLRTGAAALIGKQGVVVERIANDEGVGCIKIDGEVWTARACDEDQVIERGERVHVVEIKGATALVMYRSMGQWLD
jgi:membrane protein implicated in regulation of membrane protease activity